MTLTKRCVGFLAAAALLCALTGCGNGLAQVTGVVVLDGQPIHGGHGDTRVTVQFQPASGSGTTAIGLADENGVYKLSTGSQDGIPPGEYLVSCSASQLVPASDPRGSASGKAITDSKFANAKTSGLKFTVQPGKNQYDIAVTSPSGGAARKSK